jgi:predicted phage terminase large subunit-like protein
LRRSIRTSLAEFAKIVLEPLGLVPARHHLLLIEELERIAAGSSKRLLVLMPPGSAKSTYASIIFPPWWLARHPRSQVIAASHTASLAYSFARDVRRLLKEHERRLGVSLANDQKALADWRTSLGGGYFATGVRGPIAGRRADLLLIDDPIKSRAEADSFMLRDQIWRWYRSDLLPRLKPQGRIVLIMTRWHEDDLAGRLLSGEQTEENAWNILELPAFARSNDPLGRLPGEPLWPDWESASLLEAKRKAIGERDFSALYQQRPIPPEGLLFRIANIPYVQAASPGALRVRGWDLAATVPGNSRNPDFTVGVLLARDQTGRFVVEDVVRMQGSPDQVEEVIRRTALADGLAVTIALPQDPGQAGKAQAVYLTRALAGFIVKTTSETGAKATRAAPVAAQLNIGNIGLVPASWNQPLLDELANFPAGRHDDQVDALSRAFSVLVDANAPARATDINLFAR